MPLICAWALSTFNSGHEVDILKTLLLACQQGRKEDNFSWLKKKKVLVSIKSLKSFYTQFRQLKNFFSVFVKKKKRWEKNSKTLVAFLKSTVSDEEYLISWDTV